MDPSSLTIYNMPPQPPNWDRLGVFYVSFCAIWTTILLLGMAFCWYHRELPIIKVRGLPLAFGSIIFLHMYWCMAQITYPIGATMPIVIAYTVQYWVMGIWFPLGIALYHASNLRFLYIAQRQRTFAHPNLSLREKKKRCNGSSSSWLCRLRNLEYTKKVMVYIVVGIVFQTLLTAGMWVACSKYHPSFGIAGTGIKGATLPEQLVDLGRGWEWWPSVVWQLVWTWMVAPYLIWRSWGIRDTMGWRTQTIGTCLSGLHATPMFLIALYVPAFAKVNKYFAPSEWIHLTTMFIEIFTVFVPCYEIMRLKMIRKQVAASKNKYDSDSELSNFCTLVPSSKSSTVNLVVEKEEVYAIVEDTQPDRLFTMTALNRVLSEHPAPLQEFSAYSDFSGENIAFLTSLDRFKEKFPKPKGHLHGDKRSDAYNAALQLYIDYISPRDAEFPLNLSSRDLKVLETMFEASARELLGEAQTNEATPFAFDEPPPTGDSNGTEKTTLAPYTGSIPDDFDMSIFDAAQDHVKNLVLNNTWPKFVRDVQNRRRKSTESLNSEGTANSEDSQRTMVSQITDFVRSLRK